MTDLTTNDLNRASRQAYNSICMGMRVNLYDKNDLTPRQIEWCRAHIPMFAEMQRLRGVK